MEGSRGPSAEALTGAGRDYGANSAETRHARRLEPRLYDAPLALSRGRVVAGRACTLAAIGAGVFYLNWRLSTLGGTGVFGTAFYVAEIANFAALTLTALLLWRPRWRRGPGVPPQGSLDIFIPVCGEPLEMVEATLRAALAVDYPHRTYILNDGVLAKRANAAAVEALAARYDVVCFSRRVGERGKAGNLNYALQRTDGEFVAVIDADHRVLPELAHETLGYFLRNRVAIVTTPQQFDGPDSDPLGNRELLFYRSLQPAKDTAGSAISCGNAVVYRREALVSVDGFSRWNLLEDVHTSYELHARGWLSVYHPRALATGTAPQTARGLVRQRLRWGADSLRIFFWQSPLFKRGLRPIQRLHYVQTTGFYLVAATQVLFLLGPPLWLLWQIPVMDVDRRRDYVVHVLPYLSAIALFLIAYGGARGALRVVQQQLFLSPVYALAVCRALLPVKVRGSGVTEKAEAARVSVLLLPQVVLFVLCAMSLAVAIRDGGPGADVAGLWAGWALIGLAPFVTALGLAPRLSQRLTAAIRVGAVVAVVAALAVGGGAVPGGTAVALARPVHPHLVVPPTHGAYVGVFEPDILRSSEAVTAWNEEHDAKAQVVNVYQQWLSGERRFRADWLRMLTDQGAVPMVTWEPWRKPAGRIHDAEQPAVRLERIAAGAYDDYIRAWAFDAAAFKRPILLRFMHEMNGNWYPWSIRTNGNSERAYVDAWRHVHNIVTAAGATNVSWVWTINSFPGLSNDNRRLTEFYPGDEYVDWVSVTGFNWGTSHPWNAWVDFDQVFASSYRALARFGKPIIISEVGTVPKGGDPATWIRSAGRQLQTRYPKVKTVIWFDARYPGGVDFRLGGRSAEAFGDTFGVSSDYWSPPLALVKQPVPRTLPPPPGR